MIDTPGQLADIAARVQAAPWVAMDTEADSLHSYPEKVCLIQLSLPAEDALVDPLSGMSLAPLWEALVGRELFLHGADYDLRMLYRGYRFVPHAVFDTMIAARLLGLREFGLNALLGSLLGVQLDKGSQKANWSRRPLTDRMIAYARNDTRYLQSLAELLRERLAAQGRLDWLRQTCAQLIRDCTQPEVVSTDDHWRIKGANRLGRQALAVLRDLWQWRETEAVAANLPPFFILSHDAMIALAEHASRGEEFLRFIPQRFSQRRTEALRLALERGLACPEPDLPQPHRHHGPRLTQAQKQRMDRLERVRDRQAAALGLDPTLIASRSTLVSLASNWAKHAPELLPWQRELLDA